MMKSKQQVFGIHAECVSEISDRQNIFLSVTTACVYIP